MRRVFYICLIVLILMQFCQPAAYSSMMDLDRVITVGVDPGIPPFQYVVDGELGGFNVALLNSIADNYDLKIEYIIMNKEIGIEKLIFAGSVEATASVGGQVLPPVMGAAAFIMAEMVGIKYSQIIVHAAIPAILYYAGILIQVHLRAVKEGLTGIPKENCPKASKVIKECGHLIIPIII